MKKAFTQSLGIVAAGLVLAGFAGAASAQQTYRIAIANFGPHPTLTQLSEGFKKELADEGFKVTYDEGNVNFDRSLAPQMLNRMAATNPDLMLTITTPLTQSAKTALANRKFPIVFGAVTDPVGAKLVPSADKGDVLMTGGSNLQNMDATVKFMKTLLPNFKKLGFLYNPGDDADLGFLKAVEKATADNGIELVKVGVDNANDIPTRVQSLQGRADALLVPGSSLLQPAAAAIASTANRIKLPSFNANTTSVTSHQFLGAYTVDYNRLGTIAGKIAGQILKGKSPADIAFVSPGPADHEMKISGQRMKDLGITLPAALKDCNCVVN